jgi:hypothetical protein
MPIRYKHRVTKKVAEYDSLMGLFYVEDERYKDTGFPVPISPLIIRNDPDWEYYEPAEEQQKNKK